MKALNLVLTLAELEDDLGDDLLGQLKASNRISGKHR
jgi:hypothetical protein